MTIFLLKLTLCWGFFALLYTLLLRHETFFRGNRAYLLGTAVLGILLAALPADQMPVPVDEGGLPVLTLPEFTVGIQQVEAATNTWQNLGFLWMVYWAGLLFLAARMCWGLYKIVLMAVRGQSRRLPDGCLLIETNEAKVPFSFFKWVFVPASIQLSESLELSESSGTLMIAHERAHAHGWHSADVLFAEILCVVFWFHPLAHWYRTALRTVHEYLADAAASRQADRKQYGLLLIGQSQSGMPVAFANHFFQSPLKQRLVMLTKKASAPLRALKFGLLAPVALLFAMLFRQAPAIAQAVDEKHLEFVRELESKNWMRTDTVVTFDPNTYEETMKIVRNNLAPEVDGSGKLVYHYTEVQPQYPGGQEALVKYLADNLKYPELAQKNKVEGTVNVLFVVDEMGNVLRPIGQTYEHQPSESKLSFIPEAVRVVQAMPKWIPAQHKGKPVRCSMNLPVKFSLGTKPVEGNASPDATGKTTLVEPLFPGDLFKFLLENVKYPETARKANAEGKVFVEFMVKEDGSLADFKQVNTNISVHPDLVAEAIRVVKIMPKWKPAVQDGKVVKVKYTLPISFKLDGPKELNEVDAQPEYPGGQPELYKLLTNNVKYPEAAKKAGEEGMVVIVFVVETNGSLSSFESVKTARQDFVDEVIRVLKLSPTWKPAMKNGKAVKVKYTLPFKFKLSNDKE
ncbi:MAG: TonB family protein [Saprospiraceae bacterium]